MSAVSDISSELARTGVGYVNFNVPDQLIADVMAGWTAFLALPQEEREHWGVGNLADLDDGYFRKKGGDYDNKHVFHYRPHLFELLRHAKVDFTGQISWLLQLDRVWRYCYSCFDEMMTGLDKILPEYELLRRLYSPLAHCVNVVRLVSYREDKLEKKPLAKPHLDKCFLTIHAYQSHPGLQFDMDGKNVLYEPQYGKSLAFMGAKAHKLTDGRLKGINHGAVVPEGVVLDDSAPRQIIVFFGHVNIDPLVRI